MMMTALFYHQWVYIRWSDCVAWSRITWESCKRTQLLFCCWHILLFLGTQCVCVMSGNGLSIYGKSLPVQVLVLIRCFCQQCWPAAFPAPVKTMALLLENILPNSNKIIFVFNITSHFPQSFTSCDLVHESHCWSCSCTTRRTRTKSTQWNKACLGDGHWEKALLVWLLVSEVNTVTFSAAGVWVGRVGRVSDADLPTRMSQLSSASSLCD